METCHPIQVYIYLMVVIHSIVPLVATGSYADIPSYSNEVCVTQLLFIYLFLIFLNE